MNGGADHCPAQRLPGRPHHRQRLVELRGGRAARRRCGDRLHGDHHPSLRQGYPVVQEIVEKIYGAGLGNLEDEARIGSVYHNLGIVNGILNVEAVRIAQEVRQPHADRRRGALGLRAPATRPRAGEGARGGDLFHSIDVTWDNHEGDGYVTFQQWDGASGTSRPTGSPPTGRCGQSSRSPPRPTPPRRACRSAPRRTPTRSSPTDPAPAARPVAGPRTGASAR